MMTMLTVLPRIEARVSE